jgi:hypothetical protein
MFKYKFKIGDTVIRTRGTKIYEDDEIKGIGYTGKIQRIMPRVEYPFDSKKFLPAVYFIIFPNLDKEYEIGVIENDLELFID